MLSLDAMLAYAIGIVIFISIFIAIRRRWPERFVRRIRRRASH